MTRWRAFMLLSLGLSVVPASAQAREIEATVWIFYGSIKGTIWSAKASARMPGDPDASSPSSAGCSPEQPSSNSSGAMRQPPQNAPLPRKVYFPLQVRNEAAQWLAVRETQPLLLRTTLAAYRELRCAEAASACALSDAELVLEVLRHSEPQ